MKFWLFCECFFPLLLQKFHISPCCYERNLLLFIYPLNLTFRKIILLSLFFSGLSWIFWLCSHVNTDKSFGLVSFFTNSVPPICDMKYSSDVIGLLSSLPFLLTVLNIFSTLWWVLLTDTFHYVKKIFLLFLT